MSAATPPLMRIGAIVRKDLRLIWPLAAGSAVLQGLLGLLQHRSSPFDLGGPRAALAAIVTLALIVSMALVIVIVVQQEPLAGTNQDWVVRPIRRRDLLLAKLFLVALFIHGPILAVQIVQGYSEGFRIGQILSAALLSNLEIALLFTLPVMAIAALTRTVGEAFVGALAVLVGLVLVFLGISAAHFVFTGNGKLGEPVAGSGVQWVWRSLSHLWLLAVTVTVVAWQYFRRSTLRARALFIGGLFLFFLTAHLPWPPAFAVQEWLGPQAAAAQVRLEAAPGQSVRIAQVEPTGAAGRRPAKGWVRLMLPLRVSGVPAGSRLYVDQAVVRLSGEGGAVFRGLGQHSELKPSASGSPEWLEQGLLLPESTYRRLMRGPVTARTQYSLTVLSAKPLGVLPVPGEARVAQLGRCADRIGPDAGTLQVACMTVGTQPPCIEIRLLPISGATQSVMHCDPDYAPAALRFSADPIARFQVKLHVGSDVAAARGDRIQFITYEARSHFSRTVVIAALGLPELPHARASTQGAAPHDPAPH